jgi:hypothetical protein
MSGGTDAYRAAIEKLEAAADAAKTMVDMVHNASSKLRDMKKAFVAMPGDIVTGNPHHGIEGGSFPKADDLKRALAEYQSAGSILHNTWTNLSQEERKPLQPPGNFY